ncbi:MAG: glycosyltransferase family 2 protein [Verrucomicrobiia bacterium]|jgi:glycosyltransferase involved in cell wall biosynthesis
MLCKNEADRLVRSLPPLSDFAEIVALDSGSVDQSLALLKAAGARTLFHEWDGFVPMRRRLFSSATQPWIFWLDADEVVTVPLLENMKALFAGGEPRCAGYLIDRMVCFRGRWIRHGEWFPDWNLRLFRRDAWRMDSRAVHEKIEVNGKVGRLHGLLEHHALRDLADLRQRVARYAALAAGERMAHGKKPSRLQGALHASARFLRGYLLRRGFLDGGEGFLIAREIARGTFFKYAGRCEDLSS